MGSQTLFKLSVDTVYRLGGSRVQELTYGPRPVRGEGVGWGGVAGGGWGWLVVMWIKLEIHQLFI